MTPEPLNPNTDAQTLRALGAEYDVLRVERDALQAKVDAAVALCRKASGRLNTAAAEFLDPRWEQGRTGMAESIIAVLADPPKAEPDAP